MTPTTQTVADRVKDLIAKQFRLKTTVRPSIEFKSWIGASNQDMVDLSLRLENAFDIELDFAAFTHVQTVGDCIDLVERAVSGRQS